MSASVAWARPVSTESMPADAIAFLTSAARFSSSGRASSRVRTTCTRSGEISASPSPKPMSVTAIWSDPRFVTSSTASADSAACTTGRGPRTAIRPWATSRSTRTRPESLVPRDTRPGYGASGPAPAALLISGALRPAMAANGSRHTWPPSAACHGRGGGQLVGPARGLLGRRRRGGPDSMVPNGPGGSLTGGQLGFRGDPLTGVPGQAELARQLGRDRLDAAAVRVLGHQQRPARPDQAGDGELGPVRLDPVLVQLEDLPVGAAA